MPSIIYPITAGYRRSWTLWDALRECVYQEFLDLFKSWTITQEGGHTVVEGHGAHINLRNLLLGASDKQEEHRGRFGEGTKLGWLVLLREQIPFTLTSGDFHGLHARWADLYGEQVMEVCWEDGSFFAGSRYELDYAGELWEERVVRPGDPRILHEDAWGRMILEEAEPQFYVKGLWVGPARPYGTSCAFGYNFPDLPLAEDRQISDTWEATRRIGRVPAAGAPWGWASVADEELLTRFWHAVQDGRAEASANMTGVQVEAPKAHRRALQRAFGDRVAVATPWVPRQRGGCPCPPPRGPAVGQEAQYRGLTPVHFEWGLEAAAREIVGTDREQLAALNGAAFTLYARSRLSDVQRRVLDMLLRLAARAGGVPYILPPNTQGQSMDGKIALDISVLSDAQKAIAAWLHEAAHVEHDTDDATAAHVDAVAQVAARVIATYAVRA